MKDPDAEFDRLLPEMMKNVATAMVTDLVVTKIAPKVRSLSAAAALGWISERQAKKELREFLDALASDPSTQDSQLSTS